MCMCYLRLSAHVKDKCKWIDPYPQPFPRVQGKGVSGRLEVPPCTRGGSRVGLIALVFNMSQDCYRKAMNANPSSIDCGADRSRWSRRYPGYSGPGSDWLSALPPCVARCAC